MEGVRRWTRYSSLTLLIMVAVSGIALGESDIAQDYDQGTDIGYYQLMEQEPNGTDQGKNGTSSDEATGQVVNQESGQERKGVEEIEGHSTGYMGQFGNFEMDDRLVDGRYIQFSYESGVVTDMAWSEDDSRQQVTQDQSGRLWDVVYMASHAIRTSKESGDRLLFQLYRVPRDGHSTEAVLVTLKLIVGPGDSGEPVISILLPDED